MCTKLASSKSLSKYESFGKESVFRTSFAPFRTTKAPTLESNLIAAMSQIVTTAARHEF